MLERNEIIELIKSQVNPYLNPYQLSDKTSYFEERNYNADSDIRFIIKFLTASSEKGVSYIPMQVLIECVDKYANDVAEALTKYYYEFDYSNTGNLITSGSYKIKENITSPIVIGNFQEDGIDNYTSFSMELGFYVFESAMTLDQESLSLYINDTWYTLKNVISMAFTSVRGKDTKVVGQGNKKALERDNSIQMRITATYIVDTTDTLHQVLDAYSDDEDFDGFAAKYVTTMNTKNYILGLVQYTSQTVLADVLKAEVTFCKANVNPSTLPSLTFGTDSGSGTGTSGADGRGIVSVAKTNTVGLVDVYTITYTDGTTSTYTINNGKAGKGIASVSKTGTDGLIDTYTITYTDGTISTYSVSNGSTGNGVASVEKTSTNGLTDTYTITYTDGTKTTYNVNNGSNGTGISSIEKTSSDGTTDTYTITYTDGTKSTYEVTNGSDGHSPIISIGSNGNWNIDNVDTGVKAEATDGTSITNATVENGNLKLTLSNGDTIDAGKVSGGDGNGISSIEKTSTSNNVDTYTITYTNGTKTTFNVTNGTEANGIKSVSKTSTDGNVDTYTITYTDGTITTFNVTNGTNGLSAYELAVKNGYTGTEAEWLESLKGNSGTTPQLKINSKTNQWNVSYDGGQTWENLGVSATGSNGVSVTGATIVNGNLIITLSNGNTINAGSISGTSGSDDSGSGGSSSDSGSGNTSSTTTTTEVDTAFLNISDISVEDDGLHFTVSNPTLYQINGDTIEYNYYAVNNYDSTNLLSGSDAVTPKYDYNGAEMLDTDGNPEYSKSYVVPLTNEISSVVLSFTSTNTINSKTYKFRLKVDLSSGDVVRWYYDSDDEEEYNEKTLGLNVAFVSGDDNTNYLYYRVTAINNTDNEIDDVACVISSSDNTYSTTLFSDQSIPADSIGITYGNFSVLKGKTYTITVTDSDGHMASKTFTSTTDVYESE